METISQVRASEAPARQQPSERSRRLDQLVRDNFDFVWRLARHLGLPASDADDVAQRVMIVASNRLDDIEIGKERAFLYKTTTFIGQKVRRTWGRGREVLTEEFPDEEAPQPQPDELLDKRLDQIDTYRIHDYVVERPFGQRLVGTGNLLLMTVDRTTPALRIDGIKADVVALYERLRQATEEEKRRRGVRVLDAERVA